MANGEAGQQRGVTAVTQNRSAHRFEVAGHPTAYLAYAERPGRIRLVHTEVPAEMRGEGHASALARASLEYARDQHLRVEPACPFVREYLTRHPEFQGLVDPGQQQP